MSFLHSLYDVRPLMDVRCKACGLTTIHVPCRCINHQLHSFLNDFFKASAIQKQYGIDT